MSGKLPLASDADDAGPAKMNESVEYVDDVGVEARRRASRASVEAMTDDTSVVDVLQDILAASKEGRVDNPFRRWTSDEVEHIVKAFVRNFKLEDKLDLFLKVGDILRKPEAWRSLEDRLSPDEIHALGKEKAGFWQQPKTLRVLIATLCVAAVIQGWTQTVGNGANLNWPVQLGLDSLAHCHAGAEDVWKFGLVNAAPFIAVCVAGCWLSDPLSEYFLGRRAPIFISALLILAASIGSACSRTWTQLFACRIILGVGMGCKATVVPVFAAEVAPAHIRGSLVMCWQVFDALGVWLGYTANLAVSPVGESSWRWQMASLCIPTLIVLSLIYVNPDSPRYKMKRCTQRRQRSLQTALLKIEAWPMNVFRACIYMLMTCLCMEPGNIQKNKAVDPDDPDDGSDDEDYREAYEIFLALRGHPILAAKELLYVHVQMVVEVESTVPGRLMSPEDAEIAPRNNRLGVWLRSPTTEPLKYSQKILHLFGIPRIRRATVNALVCMISQQLCGVNVLIFYSSTLFSSTINCDAHNNPDSSINDPSNTKPLWLGWGIGLTNFLFAFPAYWLIDGRGRRWLLLTTTPLMALCMLAGCLGYLIPHGNASRTDVIALFTFVFMVFYSVGMGPVPFTMSSEVFPLEHRMVGMSLAVFTNFFFLWILTLFVPILSQYHLHNEGLLGLFTGFNVLAFFLIAFLVRETAGAAVGSNANSMTSLSLEELTYIFTLHTRDYVRYQWEQMRPWVIQHSLWTLKWYWRTATRAPTDDLGEAPQKPKKMWIWAEDELDGRNTAPRADQEGAGESQDEQSLHRRSNTSGS